MSDDNEALIAMYKAISRDLCSRLIQQLERNKSDSDSFFGGELNRAYVEATDKAIDKVRNIRYKI